MSAFADGGAQRGSAQGRKIDAFIINASRSCERARL